MLLPVILSGGVGARLWPLSREAHPKPFIRLADGQSLIQKTYARAAGLAGVNEIFTVTNRDLFFYTKDEFDAVTTTAARNTFLLEPIGRNSTAAIAVAAYLARAQHGPDAILLVLPADQLINEEAAFNQAVIAACALANQGKLVTFGIKPDAPETGFGYIEVADNKVKRFVEKPDLQTAEKYLASGNFLWNSGMFCMHSGAFIKELARFCPEIAEKTARCIKAASFAEGAGWQQYEIPYREFESIDDISVDYAVFEKSDNVATVPCAIGWSDIGSWTEFGALYPADQSNNNIAGEVLLEDTTNCVIHSNSVSESKQKLIAALGVSNLIIADTPDALLVVDKGRTQDIRKIVKKLKACNNPTYREFSTVHRPWGTYTILQEGPGFKLKRIEVKAGAGLSLQSHTYRSEHWVVVSGVARITKENEAIELKHNQSTYIPAGHKHRLENPGPEKLILIEVQCGDYLNEDDLIRHNDDVKKRFTNSANTTTSANSDKLAEDGI